MDTEKVETEKQDFMDYVLELKNKQSIPHDDIILGLIKAAIVQQTKSGHNNLYVYKTSEIPLAGIYIYLTISDSVLDYFRDQGFTVNYEAHNDRFAFQW